MTQSETTSDGKYDKQLRFKKLLSEISAFFINLPADPIER